MTDNSIQAQSTDLPSRAAPVFFLLAFLIGWSAVGPYVLFPEAATALLGEISVAHPLFFIATWAPAIAALILILWHTGPSGLARYLTRLALWRGPLGWALFVLLGVPAVFALGSILKGGPVIAPLPAEGIGPVLALMGVMLFLGPIEEFGWRGVAQPLLQRHMAPVWAGALIGAAWGLWHIPAFFLSGMAFETWSFLPFFLGNVTIAIIVTPIFNRTGGSLLWPMLFHWQLINPFWADAQPWDTWLLMAVAGVVLLVKRDRMFLRGAGVTRVIPN